MVQPSWNSHPKRNAKGGNLCRVTNNSRGVIRKYGLNVSRRVFREIANDIGFKKFD